MNEVVIRILDSTNNVLGDLDLENFNDFPLVITKGIVNLDNLKSRTGTYTKTFKAPNTKNNSNLLSNVDNINSRKDFFMINSDAIYPVLLIILFRMCFCEFA